VHLLAASAGGAGIAVSAFVFIIIGIALYFIPGIIAQVRHVPNSGSVWIINIFLGWTFVGWIVALAMAARSQLPAQQVIIQQGWQAGGPGVPGQPTGIQPSPGFQPSGEAQPQPWGQTQPLPQQQQWPEQPGQQQQWPQQGQ
jgi:hypothetical protein